MALVLISQALVNVSSGIPHFTISGLNPGKNLNFFLFNQFFFYNFLSCVKCIGFHHHLLFYFCNLKTILNLIEKITHYMF